MAHQFSTVSKSIAKQMTGIEWADFTGNGWMGCSRLKPVSGAKSGCDICYAEEFCTRRMGIAWGPGAKRQKSKTFRARFLHLNRVAQATGLNFTVFPDSLCDWLDPEVDPRWRNEKFDTMEECRALNWVPVTHRPHLLKKFVPSEWIDDLPSNIWPGVTVDHHLHGFRWQHLQEALPDQKRLWVSAEPLTSSLEPLDLSAACCIVVGGASNTKDPAWAFDTEWAKEAIARYGSKVFFKQYGVFRDGEYLGDKKAAGREIEGYVFDKTPWPRHRSLLAQIASNGPVGR